MNGLPSRRDDNAYAVARRRLVQKLVGEGIIRSELIQSAFLSVPREAFVQADSPAGVYSDTTISLENALGGWLTTSSQPTMMAIMLDQLDVLPGHRVLEIGAGTGYNAALLANIVGPGGTVHTVEYEPEAASRSAKSLAAIESTAIVHCEDGADGWAGGAPYDRIIATVAVGDLPTSWSAQAGPNARIVAPITIAGADYSVALKREGEDWVSDSIEPCSFVRFKGRLAVGEYRVTVGSVESPVLTVLSDSPGIPNANTVSAWFERGEGEPLRSLGSRDAWEGFALKLPFQAESHNVIRAVSYGPGIGWQGHAVGFSDDDGMALVTSSGRLERFGDGESADLLRAEVALWRSAGGPGIHSYRFRFRAGTTDEPGWLQRTAHSIRLETAA